jgi:hypothetical protein
MYWQQDREQWVEAAVEDLRFRLMAVAINGRDPMELILIIVLVIFLFGGGGYWGRRRGHW